MAFREIILHGTSYHKTYKSVLINVLCVDGRHIGAVFKDRDLITDLKQDVSIWNINSFGEYYLQIAEKYRNDYRESLVKIKAERRRFMNGLSAVRGLRVIPSEANYIMVECTGTMTSRKLQERLLEEYDILIKDLSAKTGGNYIRLAVRNAEDNDRLLAALDELMN